MKPNLGRGNGFCGLLLYLLDEQGKPRKGVSFGGGNMVTALGISFDVAMGRQVDHRKAIDDLCREFGRVRKIRPEAKNPVWHCSLSLPPGEHVPDEQWADIVEQMRRIIGFSAGHQYMWVRHDDTSCEHIHIVANRIGINGKLWAGAKDAEAVQNACRILEKRHNLSITYKHDEEGKPVREVRRAASARERKAEKITGQRSARRIIQDEIDALVAPGVTLPYIIERLSERGIETKLNQSVTTGRISGISFCLDGEYYAGRQLGKSYSWPGLQKRGVFSGVGLGNEPAETWEGPAPLPAQDSILEHGDLGRKQDYKVLLLAEHYQAAVGVELRNQIHRVDLTAVPTIYLKDRSQVIDHGDRVSTTRATEDSVRLMFDLACAKGWSSVRVLSTDPEYIYLAIAEAARRGIPIDNLEGLGIVPIPEGSLPGERGAEDEFEGCFSASSEEKGGNEELIVLEDDIENDSDMR